MLSRICCYFLQKKFSLGQWLILVPQMMHPQNSGSAPRVFWKIFAMEGANRCMKIIWLFLKKIIFGASGGFQAQKWHMVINLDSTLMIFWNFTYWKRPRVSELFKWFLWKNLIQGKGAILGAKTMCCHNYGSTLGHYWKVLPEWRKPKI